MKPWSLFAALFLSIFPAQADTATQVQAFTDTLVAQGFERAVIDKALANRQPNQTILNAIARPAEAKPWYQYRPLFVTPQRINAGIEFWRANKATLERARQTYQVPEQIIVAIIGVETMYGRNMGSFAAIDALYTLGFHYPRRADFFRDELRHLFLLAREEGWAVTDPKGSYAGAMGLGQFIPSSYRHYAVDFDGDGHRDLFANSADAIGSVANYFAEHQWRYGAPVAMPVTVSADVSALLEKDLEPTQSAALLRRSGVAVPPSITDDTQLRLLAFQQEKEMEYWIGFNNFYVISRYNRSPLYSLAVYQLAEELATQMNRSR